MGILSFVLIALLRNREIIKIDKGLVDYHCVRISGAERWTEPLANYTRVRWRQSSEPIGHDKRIAHLVDVLHPDDKRVFTLHQTYDDEETCQKIWKQAAEIFELQKVRGLVDWTDEESRRDFSHTFGDDDDDSGDNGGDGGGD
jgi:hypothetical protein